MSPGADRLARRRILAGCGASDAAADELLAYAESGFAPDALAADREIPLDDEPFVDAWERYAARARSVGAVAALREGLVQLRFPVVEGMSERAEYQAATRRGALPEEGAFEPAQFDDEAGIRIVLHETPAGRLPVVTARARADFERLIHALTRRNEPQPLPASMGACIVAGYNDWGRIAARREAWAARCARAGEAGDDVAWQAELREVLAQRELYQDRFVILSTGPYSGTPASDLGLQHDEWVALSHVIRLEHECAHYFTRRAFGSMKNSLLDELIADYTGIVAARGRFEPEWLVRFMGVEGDDFRPAGRLRNYRGTPPLSDEAFVVLQELVRRAAQTLDGLDVLLRGGEAPRTMPRTPGEVARAITAIAATGLEHLAVPGAAGTVYARYRDAGALAIA